MSALVLALVPLLWLPGYFALRLSERRPASRTPFSPIEKLLVEVAISMVLLLWIGVTLALVGLFTPLALLACALLPTAVLGGVVRRRFQSLFRAPTFRVDGALVAVIVLVIAGTLLYRPAFEQIVGGRDPVTYVVSGIHLARTGSWVSHDEIVTDIGVEHRRAFLGNDHREAKGHWGPRLIGWYLMDADSARVVPQGLPLYPTAIAFGYLADGVEGAVHTTTLLAIAALVALFLLGRRWLDPAVGLAAATMLLVSPAQVWFSRFANAETLAQLLLLLGLYGLVTYRREGGWAFALLAAVAFGLSWQAHIWMVWLVLPLGAILLWDLAQGRVGREALLALWLPLIVLGLQALLVYFTVTTAYLWGIYLVFKWSLPAVVPLALVAALVLVGVGVWGRRRTTTAAAAGDEAPGHLSRLRLVIAAIVVIAAVYGYWIRPALSNVWRAEAVPRLVLAVTVAVFGFAVAGVAMVLADRRRGAASMCVVAVALGLSVPVLYNPEILRPLMWSLRRYQSFLPLVFLFAAVPLWGNDADARRLPARQRWVRYAAALVTVFLLVPLAMQSWQYRGFKEPGDAIALVDDIAAGLEDDAVLIFEARSGWGALDLAPALAYWKGFDVVMLQRKETDGAALVDFVRREAQRGRPVYFFTQGFSYYVDEPRMVPWRRWRYERRQLEEVLGRLPSVVQESNMPLSVYRVEASGRNGPLEGGLDVGEWDDIYVGEAMPAEVTGDMTARWTKPNNAFFWLPGLDPSAHQIIVHAGTIQNSGAFNRTLTARLDGIVLGEIPLVQDWTDYVFDVPSDWRPAGGETPVLQLSTQPLQPDEVNGNGDTRYLGVFVNAILWQ